LVLQKKLAPTPRFDPRELIARLATAPINAEPVMPLANAG
jgi:hypothetical protein